MNYDIEFCYWGNTNNNYVGVWGITNHIIPLINEVSKKFNVTVDCQQRGIIKHNNTFTSILNLKPNTLNLNDNININNSNSKANALFIEARTFDLEKQYCIKKINSYINRGKLVMILDNNLWAKDLPERCRKSSLLLKPYSSKNPFFSEMNQKTFHYNINSQPLINDKIIDICYIGNEWGRSETFLRFFNILNESKLNIVIAGDWLREDKFSKYSHLNNILFINELPHSLTIPLLSVSHSTLQIVKPDYEIIGLMSNRIFEAAQANCLCFADNNINSINKFVDESLLVKNGEELLSHFELCKNTKNYLLQKSFDNLNQNYNVKEQARKIVKFVEIQ